MGCCTVRSSLGGGSEPELELPCSHRSALRTAIAPLPALPPLRRLHRLPPRTIAPCTAHAIRPYVSFESTKFRINPYEIQGEYTTSGRPKGGGHKIIDTVVDMLGPSSVGQYSKVRLQLYLVLPQDRAHGRIPPSPNTHRHPCTHNARSRSHAGYTMTCGSASKPASPSDNVVQNA